MAESNKVVPINRDPEPPPNGQGQAAAGVPAAPAPAAEAPGLANYAVLLFHHQKGHHSHLLNTLRFCGLTKVSLADSLEQAIQLIVSKRFDLILVSHFGEARETTKLLEDLKGHDATADIPVIAVTNTGNVKEILRIIAKGVDEVLIEPLSQEVVEQKIQQVLGRSKITEERREQMRAAQAFLANGRLEEAENLFLTLLMDPDLALEAILGTCGVQVSRQNWAEAKALLKRAAEAAKSSPDKISLHRNLSETFFAYGTYYEARKQLKPAAKSYRTAFSLNPFNLKNLVALLTLLQKEDELDEIVAVLKEVTANYLPFSQPLDDVAQCISEICGRFASLGLNEHAMKLYRELVNLRHENPEVHMQVCDFFAQEGNTGLVVRCLIEVCGRLKDPDLLHRLGTLLLESEVETIWSAFDLGGDGSLPLSMAEKAFNMAKQAFHQAMLLEPDDPRHRLGLASAELKLGNQEAAAEVLDRVRESDLDSVPVYIEVIKVLLKEKAFELAGQWLKDANANFPKEPEVARLYAQYFLARGDSGKAVAALKKGLAQSPDDRDMLLTLAQTYLRAREFGEAAFYFERLSKLTPEDPRVKAGLADALASRVPPA
ncbi:MAG: tetratricopeptide repeat protein [Thermodesulfobacteriota bacterium]